MSSLPKTTGKLHISVLKDDVRVVRDKWGIAHIYAETREDLYLALGYTMASERLFQMDVYRRFADGTLSEIFGEKSLPLDTKSKIFGYKSSAEKLLKKSKASFPIELWNEYEAFCKGINYFIDTKKLPYEFDLLGYRPDHFAPVDGFAFTGLMGMNFSESFKQDLLMSSLFSKFPAYKDLLRNMSDAEIFPAGKSEDGENKSNVVDRKHTLNDDSLKNILTYSEDPYVGFIGSNAWVIESSRTRTGFPLLANDPHIKFSLPGIWYEAHLHTPDFEIYGHFLPLIPFSVIGHNKNYGWAITMSMVDDMDFYEENVDFDRHRVLYKKEWVPLRYEDHLIKVKGKVSKI